MQVLSPRVDLNEFRDRLAAVNERVLMLDYDGTLAPFCVHPELALPYPGVMPLLGELANVEGNRIVIVSGRRAAEVSRLLHMDKTPEIWGAHGWERQLPDGTITAQVPAADIALALADAGEHATEFGRCGARIERKPASVALHWRGLPESSVTDLRARTAAAWRPIADDGVLEWLEFDGGIELRARGTNKQHAVKAVLSETGPDSAVAYLGDDITDEDAFRAVKLRGLGVLVRDEFRETEADVWIRPPRELLEFLEPWRGAR